MGSPQKIATLRSRRATNVGSCAEVVSLFTRSLQGPTPG